jgi:RHH-type transcriptional regulator, rel operon repressor / antitoxin RelB
MLAIRLPSDIEKRLARLAKRSGRTKTWYAREAILRHLEDLEDLQIAEEQLIAIREGRSRTYTLEEVERSLGLDDRNFGEGKKESRQTGQAGRAAVDIVPARARRQARKSA